MLDHEQEIRFAAARRRAIARDFYRLNAQQQEAVLTTQGPLLLLAGAGSGKTTVLIHRVANLIKYGRGSDSEEVPAFVTPEDLDFLEHYAATGQGDRDRQVRLCSLDPAAPWTILAITFTNKAAGELKDRLAALLGPEANDVWASTFHSACVRILRRDIEKLGFASSFTIYDSDDSKRAAKECIKRLGYDEKMIPVKSVLSEISRAKDELITPAEFIATSQADIRLKKIGEVYEEYQKFLKAADAMDFDDLIVNMVKLLRTNKETREYYQNRFKYIMVDEYQDKKQAQDVLTALLAVGGVLPAAEYRLLALLPGLLPRVPAANRFAQVFLSLLLPLLFLIALSEDWSTSTEQQTAPAKGRSALAWAATAVPCLVLIAFFAGWLPAYPTAIATGSMEPEIQIGDMVVMARWGLGDIQPGDVIAVERQGRTIVHRVVEVRQEAGETRYITQGDANNAPDDEPAAQSQVEGRMIGLVPAVGRISLWLHTDG